MKNILQKLGRVTLADIWASLWRGMLWVGFMRLMAHFLDVEWSWSIFWLIASSDLVSHLIYADRRYQAMQRRTATRT